MKSQFVTTVADTGNSVVLRWQPNKKQLAVANGNTVSFFDQHGAKTFSYDIDGTIKDIQWSSDSAILVILPYGSKERRPVVYLLDVKLKNAAVLNVTIPYPTSIAWNSRSHHLAIGTTNGHLILYNRITSHMERTLNKHDGDVEHLAWTAQSSQIVSAGADGTVCISDVQGNTLRTLNVPRATALGTGLVHGQETLAIGTPSGLQLLQGMESPSPLTATVPQVTRILVGDSIVTASADGTVTALDTDGETQFQHRYPTLQTIMADPSSLFVVTGSAVHELTLHTWAKAETTPVQGASGASMTSDGKFLSVHHGGSIETFLAKSTVLVAYCSTRTAFLTGLATVTVKDFNSEQTQSVKFAAEPALLAISDTHVASVTGLELAVFSLNGSDPTQTLRQTLKDKATDLALTSGHVAVLSGGVATVLPLNPTVTQQHTIPADPQARELGVRVTALSGAGAVLWFSTASPSRGGTLAPFVPATGTTGPAINHTLGVKRIHAKETGTAVVFVDTKSSAFYADAVAQTFVPINPDVVLEKPAVAKVEKQSPAPPTPQKPAADLFDDGVLDQFTPYKAPQAEEEDAEEAPLLDVEPVGPSLPYAVMRAFGEDGKVLWDRSDVFGICVAQSMPMPAQTPDGSPYVRPIVQLFSAQTTEGGLAVLPVKTLDIDPQAQPVAIAGETAVTVLHGELLHVPMASHRALFEARQGSVASGPTAIRAIGEALDSFDLEAAWSLLMPMACDPDNFMQVRPDLSEDVTGLIERYAVLCIHLTELERAAAAYVLLGNHSVVAHIRLLARDTEHGDQRAMLQGHANVLLGKIDAAQQCYLRAGKPEEAVLVRRGLCKFDEAIKLAQSTEGFDPLTILRIKVDRAHSLEFQSLFDAAYDEFSACSRELTMMYQGMTADEQRFTSQGQAVRPLLAVTQQGLARTSLTSRVCDEVTALTICESEWSTPRLQGECAAMLVKLKKFASAARLYELAGQPARAAGILIKLKDVANLRRLITPTADYVTPALREQFGNLLAANGHDSEAIMEYQRGGAECVMSLTKHVINKRPQDAHIAFDAARQHHHAKAAGMLSRHALTTGDYRAAVEMALISRDREAAKSLVLDHHTAQTPLLDVFLANITGKKDAELAGLAQNMIDRGAFSEAGKIYAELGDLTHAVDSLLESGEDEDLSLAVDLVGGIDVEADPESIKPLRKVVEVLKGEADGQRRDPRFIFQLYVVLGQYDEAAAVALAVAAREIQSAKFADAERTMWLVLSQFKARNIPAPSEVRDRFLFLHRYNIAKELGGRRQEQAKYVQLAARNLLHATTAIGMLSESSAISLRIAAFRMAQAAKMPQAMANQALRFVNAFPDSAKREIIKKRYLDEKAPIGSDARKAIERQFNLLVAYALKMHKEARVKAHEEGVPAGKMLKEMCRATDPDEQTPCHVCGTPLDRMATTCPRCQSLLEICSVTGQHMVADDWASCNCCGMPALLPEIAALKAARGAAVCSVCGGTDGFAEGAPPGPRL
ncbi:WD REPEAT-CONTAINING PROTEIN 19 [Carpediemonas membranifera]|uniref:WD REPEAT-CONTAINING PROTEIN 19 n=1 Tax=Carpediemonas membranifera TaxID=201153 RepID=A0A8J6AWT6_9EUKA|nr:WD REPEAT-CONTAINING PROTEIN 19 [Carpediemonas membranifera]|eukprot:KAG9394460.1 WD REPEAT-CONTAINING PROTEIN 19 [Carpediemonas membranifera]